MEVQLVYRNSDMTEGRGPMILDRIFLHRIHADHFVDQQPGVMGMRQQWSRQPGSWSVKPMNVIEHDLIDVQKLQAEVAAKALARLTEVEKEALRAQGILK